MQTYDLIAENDLHNEASRLAEQVKMGWALEKKKLTQFSAEEKINFLDLGCGPGVFSNLVAADFPNWQITGLDTHPDILPKETAFANTTFLHYQPNTPLPVADETVDIVYCRFLFQHLTNSQFLLEEILRVLKPGGSLIAIDVDDRGTIFSPTQAWIKNIYAAAATAQMNLQANRAIGATFPELFSQANYTVAEFEVMPITNYLIPSPALAELAFGLKRRFLEASDTTKPLVAELDMNIKNFINTKGHVIYIPIFYCRATKTK